MKTKATQKISYLLFIAIFSFAVSKLLPQAYTTEAIFSSGKKKGKLQFSFYSALPYAYKKNKPETKDMITAPSLPTETPDFNTYKSDPAVIGGVLQIKNNTPYNPDSNSLLNAPFRLKSDKPTVLILHTHTSEAYAQSQMYSYISSDAYRTEDTSRNICFVGEKLKETLEKNEINVIHDTKSHDYPSYSGCYGRSLETAQSHLAENPSIDIIIDLHRDAISDENGNYLKTSTKIDGKDSAQAVIIIGTDAGGLPHPNWKENLSLGLKIQNTICNLYPSLARPLQLRSERFNGHASPGALLIEIGSNANTMEEALYCAELVGNALSKTLLTFTN